MNENFNLLKTHPNLVCLNSKLKKNVYFLKYLQFYDYETSRLELLLCSKIIRFSEIKKSLVSSCQVCMGAFNNYVDKMRGEGFCFCPRSGYKNCPHRGGGGGQKMAKF